MKKLLLILSLAIFCIRLSAQTEKLIDINGEERGIFYHIGYNGGPPNQKNRFVLFWYTHKEIPNTYFVIEHYRFNKWVKHSKYTGKVLPSTNNHGALIKGKYLYKQKVPPHSGENRWRVLLMNDSNVCLGISKELIGTDSKGALIPFVPKVEYSISKKTKEIIFSAETYFELFDASGKLIEEGYGKTILYAGNDPGTYTLNYDNTTTTIKLK